MPETLRVNGVPLALHQEGSGEPLIFLPGTVGDYRSWSIQQPIVAQSYRTISLSRRYQYPNQDQAGGTSSVAENAEDLAALLDVRATGPVHLVGHSYGAYTALIFARKHPQFVKSLTLIEPPILPLVVKNPPGTPPQLLSLLLRRPPAATSLARLGIGALAPAEKACKQGNAIKGADFFIQGVMAGKANLKTLPQAVIQQSHDNAPTLLAELDLTGLTPFTYKEAEQIQVPTLLVRGERSPYFVRYIIDQLARHFPHNQRVAVPGVSHFVHWENPTLFNEALLTFLQQQR